MMRFLRQSLGNLIEWYDFCLFGYFATTLGQLFFPHVTQAHALLMTFAVFGIGLMARPVGGLLFGLLSDRSGRYRALNYSIIGMGMATVAMGCLPTARQIGYWAPALLMLLRLLQGISAGGQFGNLLTITTEDQTTTQKGWHTGWTHAISVLGFVLASLVSTATLHWWPYTQLSAWRIPFIFSGVLLILQVITRLTDHQPAALPVMTPMIQKPHQYGQLICLITALSTVTSSIYYLTFSYLVTYQTATWHLTLPQALHNNIIMLCLSFFCVPLFGLLSDRLGRSRTLISAFILLLLLTPVIAHHLSSGPQPPITASLILLAVATSFINGSALPFFTELFPQHIRATSCAVTFGLGTGLSGFAPMIAIALSHIFSQGLMVLFASLALLGVMVSLALLRYTALQQALI